MAKGKRNREVSGSGAGTCARMSDCTLTHKGSSSCAKNKCSRFMNLNDSKSKKYKR